MKHRFAVLVAIVVLASSLAGGFMGSSAAAGTAAPQTSPNEFLNNFTEALDVIQKNYVDQVGADNSSTAPSRACCGRSILTPAFSIPRTSTVCGKNNTASTSGSEFASVPC